MKIIRQAIEITETIRMEGCYRCFCQGGNSSWLTCQAVNIVKK